jgi:hypothetical protein
LDDAGGIEILEPPLCQVGQTPVDAALQRRKLLQLRAAFFNGFFLAIRAVSLLSLYPLGRHTNPMPKLNLA